MKKYKCSICDRTIKLSLDTNSAKDKREIHCQCGAIYNVDKSIRIYKYWFNFTQLLIFLTFSLLIYDDMTGIVHKHSFTPLLCCLLILSLLVNLWFHIKGVNLYLKNDKNSDVTVSGSKTNEDSSNINNDNLNN